MFPKQLLLARNGTELLCQPTCSRVRFRCKIAPRASYFLGVGAGGGDSLPPWHAQKDRPLPPKCPSLETLTFLSIFTLWLLEPKSSSLKERLSSFRDLLITQPREGKGRRKTHENVHLKLIAAHTVTN